MIKYKIDIFKKLKECGYNQTRIQKEKLLISKDFYQIFCIICTKNYVKKVRSLGRFIHKAMVL